MPKAILFDLDCTLTDRAASLALFASAFVEHFRGRLLDVSEKDVLSACAEVDQNGYASRTKCWPHLLAALRWTNPPSHAELDELWKNLWPQCAVAAAECRGMLERLAEDGYALGIITNGPVETQECKIDTLGIRDLMQVIVVSEAIGIAKPERAIFDHACQALSLPAGEIWFVGDHPINDAIGAKNAGLVDVWLRGYAPWPVGRQGPTFTIDRVDGILDVMKAALPGDRARI